MASFFPGKTLGKILLGSTGTGFFSESLFYLDDVEGRELLNPVALTSGNSHSKLDLKSSCFSSEAKGNILLTLDQVGRERMLHRCARGRDFPGSNRKR